MTGRGTATSAKSPEDVAEVRETHLQVKEQMKKIQSKEGDSLLGGFISKLPEQIHVDLSQNKISELLAIWNQWSLENQKMFTEKYGAIARLLQVKCDNHMIRAIIQFWDPSYRCFTFNEVDMTPTIEEYSALLEKELEKPYKIYWKSGKTSLKGLQKIMGINQEEIEIKKKNETICVPWDFLKNFIQRHMNDDRGRRVMALAIYGLVIFPKIMGYVDLTTIDLFEQIEDQVHPVTAILAETFRSLSHCRKNGGRFVGCIQMLYIWIRSHFECKESKFRTPFLYTQSPISEFLQSKWPEQKSKEEWVLRLANLRRNEVVWRAPWMHRARVIYKCGDEHWVPLLGLWGATSYAPMMVFRQFLTEQFVPVTHGLDQFPFDYGERQSYQKTKDIYNAWKKIYKVDVGIVHNVNVTTNYIVWHVQRAKNVKIPQMFGFSASGSKKESEDIFAEIKLKFVIEQAELKHQNEELQKKLETETERQNQLQAKLKRRNNELQSELTRLKKEGEDQVQEGQVHKVRKLQMENQRLRQERNLLRSINKQHITEFASLNQEVAKLKEENEQLKECQAMDHQKMHQLQAECEQLESDIQEFKRLCDKIRQTSDMWRYVATRNRVQLEYLEEQTKKAGFTARVMKRKAEMLRREIYPMGAREEKLLRFMNEALGQYKEVLRFLGWSDRDEDLWALVQYRP